MAADLGYIDAANNQFFAEETLVEIIPNFERSELQFLSVADNRLKSVLICLPSSYFYALSSIFCSQITHCIIGEIRTI